MTPLPRARLARVLFCCLLVAVSVAVTTPLRSLHAQPQSPRDITMALADNESMLDFLLRFKLDTAEAIAVAELIDNALPMDERQGGAIVQLRLGYGQDVVELRSIQIETLAGRSLLVRRAGAQQYAIEQGRATDPAAHKPAPAAADRSLAAGAVLRIRAAADGNANGALIAAGAPAAIVAEALQIFRLYKDISATALDRASIELLYVGTTPAAMLVASAEIDGHTYRVWRYAPTGLAAGYFDENGARIDGAELQAPIANGRITSPWGMRKHPVLRVMRFHMGVDYEAAAGTPVYAAADGVVAEARKFGNYGLYLKLAHGERTATIYAHLQKLEPALKPGNTVKRGDVIAYVGHCGLASGPHLYFEVLVDNKRVNPEQWVGFAGKDNLAGADLAAFEHLKQRTAPSLKTVRRAY